MQIVTSIISYITSHGTEIVTIAGAVVMTARLIVKLTPTPADDSVLEKIVNFLSHVGLKL
jgi:hypothetical protein